jgi:hypothetical protein
MVYSENNIKSEDISRCNEIFSPLGYYIGHDGGTDIYPTIKIYKKLITDTSYDLILTDNIDFNLEYKIEGGNNRFGFIFENINLSEITNAFLFQESTPSLEKTQFDPKGANVDIDRSLLRVKISGKISSVIGYLVVLLRSEDLSQKVWGFDDSGLEIFLPKFSIGDLVSPIGENVEMKVIGYSLLQDKLGYNCLIPDSKFPTMVSQMKENNLRHSRSYKIDQILK